jgi:transposase
MLRSTSVQTIRDLAAHGHSIRAIATQTGIARNTVRKYLRGTPDAAPRPRRTSKLDPFRDQIRRWVLEDRLLNCQTILERLQQQGYTGRISILKDFVQPLRPPRPARRPVRRYETKPGEQMQLDWGEFLYEQDGQIRKLYGFTAVLSYSRMRFVVFTKRCDTPSLIRCLMLACEYVEGLPTAILTDRMKNVLLTMDGSIPQWNRQFADFLTAIGVIARVCRAYTPQTKGKVERSIGVVKQSFWPGVRFTDLDDLNRQARHWCDRRNQRVHATTRVPPLDRWVAEGLRPLPQGFAWERFRLEDRRVTPDGFVSFDGVLYGVPAAAGLTGRQVQVGSHQGQLTIWSQGQRVAEHRVRPVSGTQVLHPTQFQGVPPAHTHHAPAPPLGRQVARPESLRRALDEYDHLYGVVPSAGEVVREGAV